MRLFFFLQPQTSKRPLDMGCHPAARPAAQVSCPLLLVIYYSSLFNVLPYPSQPPSPPLFTRVKFYSLEKTTRQELGGKCNKSFFLYFRNQCCESGSAWMGNILKARSGSASGWICVTIKVRIPELTNWILLPFGGPWTRGHRFASLWWGAESGSASKLTVGSESEPTDIKLKSGIQIRNSVRTD